LATPTNGQTLTSAPINITGAATDNVGVTSVRLELRRTSDQAYWNGTTFQPTSTFVLATLASPGATSTSWSYSFNPGANASYSVRATAVDAKPNVDGSPAFRSFSLNTSDVTAPDGTLTTPATNGQAFGSTPINLAGTATDNIGVAQVRLVLRRVNQNQWWNGTAWQPTSTFVLATLAPPNGTATNWSYAFTPGVTGSFSVQVTAVDAANNQDGSKPFRQFVLS